MITAYDVCIYGSSIYLSAAAYIFAAALDLFDAVSDVNQQYSVCMDPDGQRWAPQW